ncbi:MAG: deoxynucleoside kinase [Bacteroidaceae bacterium]|nr:deoxynucleoside kinase [Bacteroidaceae bacterium]
MFIAVAGNIGAGKTTLTGLLAKHYGWEPRFEVVAENPYMEDYYKNIHRWSFCLETFFLKERFRDLLEISKTDKDVIQDRSIFEGVHVFAANNQAMGNMEQRDYQTFMELFEQMTSVARTPDLMIYLKASIPHLVANIQKRGRSYEQAIPIDYLQNLNDRYEDFINNKYTGKVLTIEVDNLDFLNKRDDFFYITEKIDRVCYSLFPED